MDEVVLSNQVPLSAPKIRQEGARVDLNLTHTEFVVPARQDIPGDGSPQHLHINHYKMPAQYQYYTVPKLEQRVYLTARVTDWQQYSLLSGPMNLYFDGNYVGQSKLLPQAEDTLVVSLGPDRGIQVSRTRDTDFRKKRFLSGKIEQQIGWTITVQKNRKNDVPILIEDQLPLSTHQNVSVDLTEATGATLEEDTGLLRWEINPAFGKTVNLNFRYEVKYPKGFNFIF